MTPLRNLRGEREGEKKGSKETRERKKEKEGRVEDLRMERWKKVMEGKKEIKRRCEGMRDNGKEGIKKKKRM